MVHGDFYWFLSLWPRTRGFPWFLDIQIYYIIHFLNFDIKETHQDQYIKFLKFFIWNHTMPIVVLIVSRFQVPCFLLILQKADPSMLKRYEDGGLKGWRVRHRWIRVDQGSSHVWNWYFLTFEKRGWLWTRENHDSSCTSNVADVWVTTRTQNAFICLSLGSLLQIILFQCLGGGVHPQVAIGTHIHGREEKPDSAKAIVKPPTHWAGGKLSVLNWL